MGAGDVVRRVNVEPSVCVITVDVVSRERFQRGKREGERGNGQSSMNE